MRAASKLSRAGPFAKKPRLRRAGAKTPKPCQTLYRIRVAIRLGGGYPAGNFYSAPRNTKRSKKSADRTQIRGLICRIFPVPILMKVYESNPRLNPVAILKVSGVATR